ncbi:phage tail-collar fiber domain-containing protein [Aeromonas veronii]|uniref:phage tail-collar fiber domain-containing protein n=1 Tax=Aeromonas veronii TaxID=654 RepID=UPI002B4A5419|nr:phage tail protein [Aeromonas veronii]
MSQVITNAFEKYWQGCLLNEQVVVLDEFILADIPNLDITSPIDPNTGLPPESQIVHRQNVDQRGRINNNAVAYTIVMDTTVGDFSFNAMYLRNKTNGVIGMIVYKGRETKLKTDQTTGQTGNSLVKSMLMGYDQAAEATLTNVDAGTWQIDYAARLRGMDEDVRQLQADLYGHHSFVGDGFKVVEKDGAYLVSQGVAIIGGLRVELKAPEVIHPGTKPIGVWVDVHRAGSLLSEHQNLFTIITSVADLADHVDDNGYQHYVAKLCEIDVSGGVIDIRVVGNDDGKLFIFREELEGPNKNGLNGFYAGDGWEGDEAGSGNIYNQIGYEITNALGFRYRRENVGDGSPIIWLEKETQLDRGDGVKRWDAGAAYLSLSKETGSAYGAAVTGVAKHKGGTGDMIGVHGRGIGYHANAKVWGGWSYAHSNVSPDDENVIDLIGHEVNVRNGGKDAEYIPPTGKGIYRGLVVNTSDGSNICGIGIDIGRQTSTGAKGWYHALRLRAEGVVSSYLSGVDTSQLLIEGSSQNSNRYGGISFRGGVLDYAIDMTKLDAAINNQAALTFKYGHRMRWGSKTSSRYVHVQDSDAGMVDFVNYSIGVNGKKVVGDRQLGWTAFVGDTYKGAFDSTVSFDIGSEYSRDLIVKIVDALNQTRKRLCAIEGDNRNHGLIN